MKAQNHRKPWSQEEIQFLEENYGYKPVKWVAQKLKRSIHSISCIAGRRDIPFRRDKSLANVSTKYWAQVLGITHDVMVSYIYRKIIVLGKYDLRNLRKFTISEDTMVAWLKKGNALRCRVNKHTPSHIAKIIQEESERWVSHKELIAIDSWLNPTRLFKKDMQGMTKLPLVWGLPIDQNLSYYRLDDVYAHMYNQGVFIPQSIKHPYFSAVRIAWESKYVRYSELRAAYRVKGHDDHPKPVTRGVYLRTEIVAWLRSKPKYAHLVRQFMQDEISYQEIHADIERKKNANYIVY